MKLVPKEAPKASLTWLWIITLGLLLSLVLFVAFANAQTQATGKVIHCARQGIDSSVNPPKPFMASRCRMVFKMPEEKDLTIVARRLDTGAVLFSKSTQPGETVEVLVQIPLGFPASTEALRGQVVVQKPSANPDAILPTNVAPVQETVAAEFLVPALTPAEFLRALLELGAI